MKTDIKELAVSLDGSFVLNLNISLEQVLQAKNHSLEHLQENFSQKGFRPGKVPLDIVEKNIDQEHLLEHAITELLNSIYPEKIKQYQLNPIIDPKISIVNPPLTFDKAWQIKLECCSLPKIELNKNYQAEIKKAKKDDVNQLLEIVIKNSKITFPPILLETELNRHLTKIIDQTQAAGINFSDYLKTKNLTNEKYREQVILEIKNEWTLNLAISQISIDEKLNPSDKEINDYLLKKPELKTNQSLVNYILTQQKVVDFLKNL